MPDLCPIFDRRNGVSPKGIARMTGHAGYITWRPLKGDGAALRADAEAWFGPGDKAVEGVYYATGCPRSLIERLFDTVTDDGIAGRVDPSQLAADVTLNTFELMFAGLAAHADWKRAAKAAAAKA